MKTKEYALEVNGKVLTCEFNDLANQANGSCIVKYGDTSVLATAVISKFPKDNFDFFPLTVDFEEKFYAIGKILGGRYSKREGRPTDEAILSGRIVDRTIRPLFEDHIRHEVQVTVIVLSLGEDDPDVLAVIAASLALGTSSIPWNGPVSAIRIGKNGEHKTNPTYEFIKDGALEMDLVACGKDGNINMIEVGSKEISNETINDGLKKASEEIEKIQEWQKKIISEIGKTKKIIEKAQLLPETIELFEKEITPKLESAIFSGPGKKNIEELKEEWQKIFTEQIPDENLSLALDHYEETIDEILHKEAIENNRRADGRGMEEVRPLYAQAGGISPIIHGSGIFYRGGTHV